MNLLSIIQIPYLVSGLGVGLVVGMTGVGGGALMTPVLVLVFGLHPASAVGTDLLYASVTKGFGTMVHGFGRSIQWSVVGLLASGSIPAAMVMTVLLHRLDVASVEVGTLITKVLACALIITAFSLVFHRSVQRVVRQSSFTLTAGQRAAATVGFGMLIGALVTMTSVGAGSIGMSVLVLLYPNVPISRIVGTDIAHAVPLTMIAGLGHLSIGTVDTALLASLLAGSIPGVIIGSLLSPRLPEVGLRYALASVLMAVSILLFLK